MREFEPERLDHWQASCYHHRNGWRVRVADPYFRWSRFLQPDRRKTVLVLRWVGPILSAFSSSLPRAARFVTTHWSVVVRAGGGNSAAAQMALAELCETYWYPLYAYVRRRGNTPEQSQDLTQAFFARLLEKNYVADARQEKGKFRGFLLVALKRFLADEWGRERAQKRGGFQRIVSIDQELAESRLHAELADDQSPDVMFERQWAMALLEKAGRRLREEYEASGRAALFERLQGCLTRNETSSPYAEIAAALDLTVPAVKMAVHRLRGRYRELLRQEIAKTVTTAEDIEGEIRHLFSLFGP